MATNLFYNSCHSKNVMKWNSIIWKLWDWLFFTQHIALKIYLSCCIHQYLFFVLLGIIPWYGPTIIVFLIHLLSMSGLCTHFGYYKKAAVMIHEEIFCECFHFCGIHAPEHNCEIIVVACLVCKKLTYCFP